MLLCFLPSSFSVSLCVCALRSFLVCVCVFFRILIRRLKGAFSAASNSRKTEERRRRVVSTSGCSHRGAALEPAASKGAFESECFTERVMNALKRLSTNMKRQHNLL